MRTRATKNSLSFLLALGRNVAGFKLPGTGTATAPPRLPPSRLTHRPSILAVRLLVKAYSTPPPSAHPVRQPSSLLKPQPKPPPQPKPKPLLLSPPLAKATPPV